MPKRQKSAPAEMSRMGSTIPPRNPTPKRTAVADAQLTPPTKTTPHTDTADGARSGSKPARDTLAHRNEGDPGSTGTDEEGRVQEEDSKSFGLAEMKRV